LPQERIQQVIKAVNCAYKLLKSDFERGNLLLQLMNEKSIGEDSQFGADEQEFVIEMLDISEVIFESNMPEELAEARKELLVWRDKLNTLVKEQFSSQQYQEVRANLAKLNVLNKKLVALDERLAQSPELQAK
jgi:hypothetical protein